MKNSSNLFKSKIDDAFKKLPILNITTMGDADRYKKSFTEEKLEGGIADKMTIEDIAKKHTKNMMLLLKKQLKKGIKVEMEHTKNKEKAKEIAMDHLFEIPDYYNKIEKIESNESKYDLKFKDGDSSAISFSVPNDLHSSKKKRNKTETKEATGSGSSGAFVGPIGFSDKFMKRSNAENKKLTKEDIEKVEAKEATTSGSSGGYETPAMWAKSTKKKDWGPIRRTQYPGGSFVQIKKKCSKFPYCNQGDINALKLSKNESVKEAIERVSRKIGLSKDTIITILEHEYEKLSKRAK